MEILECQKDGENGFKCGELGYCHIGVDAWQNAVKDQKNLLASEYIESPLPLPPTAEELEAQRLALIQQGEEEAEQARLVLLEAEQLTREALIAEAEAFEAEKLLNP